jgi:hypothetical protein
MSSQHVDKAYLIRLLRVQAHLYSCAEAPRVSKEAISLNQCADILEGINQEHPVSTACQPD